MSELESSFGNLNEVVAFIDENSNEWRLYKDPHRKFNMPLETYMSVNGRMGAYVNIPEELLEADSFWEIDISVEGGEVVHSIYAATLASCIDGGYTVLKTYLEDRK